MKGYTVKALKYILIAAIIISFITILAVSWHSVDEIHYLKSFYPRNFTVSEAFYAAGVELIKIHIISLPLITIIILALYLLWLYRERQ